MSGFRLAVGLVALLTAACSSSKSGGVGMMTMPGDTTNDAGPTAPDASPYIPGFDPPAVANGYTRYITPTIDNIGPGFDELYCQWLTGPASEDQDVLNLTGLQSEWGHHIAVYAQTEVEPVGTSRLCTTDDMLSITFLGAIGSEGTADIFAKMPPDTVFRLPKGQVLMANTHFLNSGTNTVEGQGVVDLEFSPPSSSHKVAGMFTNVGDTFSIPPHGQDYAYDTKCVVQSDMDFFAFTNHMHQYGSSAYTEVIHANGSKTMINDNTYWTSDMEFNPPFVTFPPSSLFSIVKGDTVHTHCEWTNTTSTAQTFPNEMCVGIGFDMSGGAAVNCVDGAWPSP